MTTNQDTQFVKLYPEEKVSEIQGDHRFFQCSRCCQDDTWDAVEPVNDMIRVMGEGTSVPAEMIPGVPTAGRRRFPGCAGTEIFCRGGSMTGNIRKSQSISGRTGTGGFSFWSLAWGA